MCTETQSLATALLPKFASDVGYDVLLMQLISDYQKNPGTETYKKVQDYLVKQRFGKQYINNTFNNDKVFSRIDLNILDYEDNLLWSTAPLENQDKIVLLYQASDYSPQATQGSVFKQFETGEKYSLSWVSGSLLFPKGGSLRIGANLTNYGTAPTIMDPSHNLTVYAVFGNDKTTVEPITWIDSCGNSWSTYTYTQSGNNQDNVFRITNSNLIPDGQYVPISYLLVGVGGNGFVGSETSGGGGGGGGAVLQGIIDYTNQNQSYDKKNTIIIYLQGNGNNSSIDFGNEYSLQCNAGFAATSSTGGNSGESFINNKEYFGGYIGASGPFYIGGGGAGSGANGINGGFCPSGGGGIGTAVTQLGIPTIAWPPTGIDPSGTIVYYGAGGGGGSAPDADCPGGTGGKTGGGNGGENGGAGTSGANYYGGGGGGGSSKNGGGGLAILSLLTSYLAT